jgi:hypothetical protein
MAPISHGQVCPLLRKENTMTIIEKLHANLPLSAEKIRKSRMCTSGLVATGLDATRSALVAEADDDGMYLIATFHCGPKEVDSLGFGAGSQGCDYRLYSWVGIVHWVEAFLAGASDNDLCSIEQRSSSHRFLDRV